MRREPRLPALPRVGVLRAVALRRRWLSSRVDRAHGWGFVVVDTPPPSLAHHRGYHGRAAAAASSSSLSNTIPANSPSCSFSCAVDLSPGLCWRLPSGPPGSRTTTVAAAAAAAVPLTTLLTADDIVVTMPAHRYE